MTAGSGLERLPMSLDRLDGAYFALRVWVAGRFANRLVKLATGAALLAASFAHPSTRTVALAAVCTYAAAWALASIVARESRRPASSRFASRPAQFPA